MKNLSEMRWNRAASPAYIELERVKYAFDRAGNRKWHDSLIATSGQDEIYTYDKLNQLTKLERGTQSGSSISGVVWKEEWKFDSAGNWHDHGTGGPVPAGGGYKQTSSTTVLLDQNRTNNKANEILSFTAATGSAWSTPTYDKNGNMTVAPNPGASGTTSLQYDAWNRLVKATATVGGAVLGTYSYDGLDRRITKTTAGPVSHDYYYSDQWQLLHDYVGSAAAYTFVWGLRYPDDLLARIQSSNGARYWALHDYLHVTAAMDTAGGVQMRLGYDGYGQPRMMNGSYVNSGIPNDLLDWEFRFGAAYWDKETGLYQMRYRYLHPRVGTWATRDPIGYEAGLNVFSLVGNRPSSKVDPLGLQPNSSLDCVVVLRRQGPSQGSMGWGGGLAAVLFHKGGLPSASVCWPNVTCPASRPYLWQATPVAFGPPPPGSASDPWPWGFISQVSFSSRGGSSFVCMGVPSSTAGYPSQRALLSNIGLALTCCNCPPPAGTGAP